MSKKTMRELMHNLAIDVETARRERDEIASAYSWLSDRAGLKALREENEKLRARVAELEDWIAETEPKP